MLTRSLYTFAKLEHDIFVVAIFSAIFTSIRESKKYCKLEKSDVAIVLYYTIVTIHVVTGRSYVMASTQKKNLSLVCYTLFFTLILFSVMTLHTIRVCALKPDALLCHFYFVSLFRVPELLIHQTKNEITW